MNMFREKISIPEGVSAPVTVRAKVYVMETRVRAERGGPIEEAIIVVTIPPSQHKLLPIDFRAFEWRGATFYRQGLVIPIVALGRVDHYEITATSTEPLD